MKMLGFKSLSAALYKAVNIIWWVEWLAFFVLVTTVIVVALVKKVFGVSVPVSFVGVTLKQVFPANKNLASGTLAATCGNFNVQVDATWQNVLLLLAGFAVIFSAVILITYQLKVIFLSLRQNLPFMEENISRIKHIATVLIAYSVVWWLYVIVVNQVLVSQFRWEQTHLTYSFNFSYLLTGIVLLIVAEIFKLGTFLDNERKLTI